ncbi:hypothetical protein LINPERHAP1_LOCUS36794 [Linum perenne]
MDHSVFKKLCKILVEEGELRRPPTVSIDEMVVMFLYTLGNNVKNRILQKRFGRSGKTVCAVLHTILTSILRLHNCLGALDGTHIKIRARIQDQPRYRNTKGEVSINILGMCNPDCQFIYCLAGWEGFVHDARVLRDAVARSSGLKVPKGNINQTPQPLLSTGAC